MHKSAGGVPWLYLLAEEELDLCRVLFGEIREYRIIEGLEHFGREGTDIVEVDLDLYSIQNHHCSFTDNNRAARQAS